MGHIGHAQVIATIESTEDIGGGLYASDVEGSSGKSVRGATRNTSVILVAGENRWSSFPRRENPHHHHQHHQSEEQRVRSRGDQPHGHTQGEATEEKRDDSDDGEFYDGGRFQSAARIIRKGITAAKEISR
jgi:hypothetical protein